MHNSQVFSEEGPIRSCFSLCAANRLQFIQFLLRLMNYQRSTASRCLLYVFSNGAVKGGYMHLDFGRLEIPESEFSLKANEINRCNLAFFFDRAK